jgi:hypothetical protein
VHLPKRLCSPFQTTTVIKRASNIHVTGENNMPSQPTSWQFEEQSLSPSLRRKEPWYRNYALIQYQMSETKGMLLPEMRLRAGRRST